ncbi:WAT1-related protein [Sesamum alatum]|uniref:WAT1-related protein n=1 Tax=Sesamum alatum TaxID=300844 RepID=A0AAE1Y6I8_9LAMI|nr:WAT1-related protein [Sesamum alatum]
MMGKVCDVVQGLKPTIMMVCVQIVFAGVSVFYKLAANDGMSLQVLIAYRFMFAAATVVPLALIIDRKNRPKLTWKIALQAFVSALFGGSVAQNLFAESLVLTSATFAAAMTNLVPAVTFILAIFFRMERVGLKTRAGKAKVTGTFLCIGGAMLLTFYKGCEVNIWSTHFDLLHKSQHPSGHVAGAHHKSVSNILGPLLALGCCLSSSLSLIIQAKMSETYPCHYSSTALISVMGSVQAVVFALCTVRDWRQWKLGWNIRLLSVSYMGIVASGLMWAFIMSCVRMRGPLFVSVFNPLLLVIVALVGSLLLNENVLGAAVIICGLYSVLWGKSKEMKKITRLVPSKSFTEASHHEVEETARESFKGFNHANNVVAVAPNFLPESEILEVFDEDEDDEDLEAAATKISNPQTKP